MCPRERKWAHRTALWRKFFPSTGVELKVARLAITNTLTAEVPLKSTDLGVSYSRRYGLRELGVGPEILHL